MQEIIKRIKAQQKAMGYTDFIDQSEENQVDYIRDITLALIKETTEFLDETPWKPWKKKDEQHFHRANAIHEICDIIVFAIVLHLTVDPDVPLEMVMGLTLDKIDERINNGYGQKEK